MDKSYKLHPERLAEAPVWEVQYLINILEERVRVAQERIATEYSGVNQLVIQSDINVALDLLNRLRTEETIVLVESPEA